MSVIQSPGLGPAFEHLYRNTNAEVLAFVARRVPPSDVEDVAARTYLAAWRRFDELPTAPDDRRAWIFGAARNCVRESRRAAARSRSLTDRLGAHVPVVLTGGLDDAVGGLVDIVRAWQTLSAGDQEVLALIALDGLEPAEAAQVLGVSSPTLRARLMRARNRLRNSLEGEA